IAAAMEVQKSVGLVSMLGNKPVFPWLLSGAGLYPYRQVRFCNCVQTVEVSPALSDVAHTKGVIELLSIEQGGDLKGDGPAVDLWPAYGPSGQNIHRGGPQRKDAAATVGPGTLQNDFGHGEEA